MRRKLIIFLIILLLITVPVFAITKDFIVDLDKSFDNNKSQEINGLFSKEYAINGANSTEKINKEYEALTKKTTYYLLGSPDKAEESAEEFYKRKTEFYELRYAPEIPKTDDPNKSFYGLDSTTQEFKDDILSGMAIPGMWKKITELEIDYDYLGDIKTDETEYGFKSSITIPKIRYKVADENEPTKYKNVTTDLTMYYMFKKNKYQNDEYQLYYLLGETTEELDAYFDDLEKNENKGIMGIKTTYNSDMSTVYDYSKLSSLNQFDLQRIYDNNANKVMILSTYYNNSIIDVASGFLINNNVLVTTWSYLESALLKGQYISIRDKNTNSYEFGGIITIDINSDIALIKINNCSTNGVVLGNSKDMIKEDPVISFSTKSGMGISSQTGIIISNNNKLESFLPITQSDIGGPVFNKNGQVVGINTNESINKSLSYSAYTDVIKELQIKFSGKVDIETVSFEELKEQYYYSKNNKEKISNNINKGVWNKYSKIGNIEESIKLPLLKAYYSSGIVSLRYDNSISKLMNNKTTNTFINKLKKDGYKEILNCIDKSIYQNNKYKVIIFNEFDYLIIVMVKL